MIKILSASIRIHYIRGGHDSRLRRTGEGCPPRRIDQVGEHRVLENYARIFTELYDGGHSEVEGFKAGPKFRVSMTHVPPRTTEVHFGRQVSGCP